MRKSLTLAACLAAATSLAEPAKVVLSNARVRVSRGTGAEAVAGHPSAVVVHIEDGPSWKAGDAYWSGDPEARPAAGRGEAGLVVIVEPRAGASATAPKPPAATPDPSAFVGMSFTPVFDNDRVRVLRARMEVGAKEGVHTHGSDIVVVHLSGGDIEDTAGGKTRVNHWKPGDVEFEGQGTSHSARNLGAAIDVVLVSLKP
jgi:quercetin dioxygenase-like cupin family protein